MTGHDQALLDAKVRGCTCDRPPVEATLTAGLDVRWNVYHDDGCPLAYDEPLVVRVVRPAGGGAA